MKKSFILVCVLLLMGIKANATVVDSMLFGVFGKVTIYHPAKEPEAVVLFISGDGGWNKGVVDMALNLQVQGALVVGIDIQTYFRKIKTIKSKCYYPASDFENLSLTIQKKYKLKEYLKPVLAGYSSGATLVYAILAQAPANTFKGAIALGFCPDIETDRPLCPGAGLSSHVLKPGISYYLEANNHLTAPFIVLEGLLDQVCSYNDTKIFLESMPMTELISLPKVGHGFSVTKNWLPQFIDAYRKILIDKGYTEKLNSQNKIVRPKNKGPFASDMPLIINTTDKNNNLPLAFLISGDGGWTSFDQDLCEKLSQKGIPVIGLDAQKYFWNEKQPKETALEILKAINYYSDQWDKKTFILIGYSFGASAVPFIADNIPLQEKTNLKGVFCLSPDETGDFEIHISDMLNFGSKEKYDVIGELKKIAAFKPVCIFGEEEDAETTNHFKSNGIKVELLPGSHHYNENYEAVVDIVLGGI